MASRVVMPKLSDTMEEGRILRWLRQEGDRVETGESLAEIETDKATVEMEVYTTGVVRRLLAPEGQTIRVGDVIAVIGEPDEDITALVTPTAAPPPAATTAAATSPPPAVQVPPRRAESAVRGADTTPERPAAGRAIKASPLALRMAAEAGLDLTTLAGSGPQGRIVKRDIEAALAAARAATLIEPHAAPQPPQPLQTPQPEGGPREIELSSMRRTIARRLVQSKGPIPHFYLTVDVHADRLWDEVQALKQAGSSATLNDVIIMAAARALARHPALNASFAGDRLLQYTRVHIGVAVAVDDGVITPVVRDAHLKALDDIATETKALIERARAGKLLPDEYAGATFSISNLGMMGIEEFSAVINPPEAAVLAVGAVRETPVADGGSLRVGRRMKLTLSVDHRVADGRTAARFLQALVRMLEYPLLMA